MLAAVDGMERGQVDPGAALAAIDALPAGPAALPPAVAGLVDGLGRRHASPAVATAFAEASRAIGPRDLPIGYLVWLASQQLLLTLCFVFVIVIARLIGLP